jgi:hypothetical protein
MESNCLLCENPYPYWCEDCQACLIEETQIQEKEQAFVGKRYIGSGEDFCQQLYQEYDQTTV